MHSLNRHAILTTCILALSCAAAMAQAAYIPLDISGGFNVDAICGQKEFQAIYDYGAAYTGKDLQELQGSLGEGVGRSVFDWNYHMMSATTAAGADPIGYGGSTWGSIPKYYDDTEALPEDGVIISGDTVYHMASHLGNATLSGDWTEVADPVAGPPESIPNMPVKLNTVYAYRNTDSSGGGDPSVTVDVAPGQYSHINFVLGAPGGMTDGARFMQIVALYGDSSEEILFSFSTDDVRVGPVISNEKTDVYNAAEFNVVHQFTLVYNNDSGAQGGILTARNGTLFEFADALPLNIAKTLVGFRVEDTGPPTTTTNDRRGLAIFAASVAVPAGTPTADAGIDQTILDADDSGAETVTLDGTGSYDSDGFLVSYQWLEDGSEIATGATAQVSLSVGVHTIRLTVTDDASLTSSDTVVITIQTSDPVADAGADQTVMIGDSATLDGAASYDPAGTIVSYDWTEGVMPVATGMIVDVTLGVGVHVITLTVTDDSGYAGSDTVVITVDPGEPTARAGSDQAVMATPAGSALVTLDGSASTDPVGSIVSYEWTESDAPLATGVTAEVSFGVGVHTLTLTVTDNHGQTDNDQVVITVAEYVEPQTFYLDVAATGPVFDGSQANPFQTVEQMQDALWNMLGKGSRATVLIAPGFYGEFIEGSSDSSYSAIQLRRPVRTDWLTLRAADPDNKPEFRYIHLYGDRNAYVEFDGLHVRSLLPHKNSCVYVRNATRYLRFRNMVVEAEDDGTNLPYGIYLTYNRPSDILIEGCELRFLAKAIQAGADNLLVRNNEIHHIAGSGVATSEGVNVVVENNHIYHQYERMQRLKLYGPVTGTFEKGQTVVQDVTGATGTVYIVETTWLDIIPTQKTVIEFETGHAVRNTEGDGVVGALASISVSDWTHASGLSVRTTGYTARGNRIHNYGGSAAIFLYPASDRRPFSNMLFENNLVYDAIGQSAVLSDIGDNFVFRNNTIVGRVSTYIAPGYDGSGLHLYNNLFRDLELWDVGPLANLHEAKNIIQGIKTRTPFNKDRTFDAPSTSILLGFDEDAAFDVLFVDVAGEDFRLAPASQAIGFADPALGPAVDMLGNDRDDAASCAGAIEAIATVTLPGDADGDSDVDLDDFVILKQNFGTTSGATRSEGDFDGDGDVDLEDFVILKSNFGT